MTDTIIDELSPKNATVKIREISKIGYITLTCHIQERMEQKNYDGQDLDLILSEGKVKENPEYDKEYETWKYRVKGHAIDGSAATVVVAISSDLEINCITIIGK
jgi:hypothetical protein